MARAQLTTKSLTHAARALCQAVPPSSPHYSRARVALAGVHLRARRDKAAYIRCYLDLVVRVCVYVYLCVLHVVT